MLAILASHFLLINTVWEGSPARALARAGRPTGLQKGTPKRAPEKGLRKKVRRPGKDLLVQRSHLL